MQFFLKLQFQTYDFFLSPFYVLPQLFEYLIFSNLRKFYKPLEKLLSLDSVITQTMTCVPSSKTDLINLIPIKPRGCEVALSSNIVEALYREVPCGTAPRAVLTVQIQARNKWCGSGTHYRKPTNSMRRGNHCCASVCKSFPADSHISAMLFTQKDSEDYKLGGRTESGAQTSAGHSDDTLGSSRRPAVIGSNSSLSQS